MPSKKKNHYSDEISLAELVFIIWINKWKVVLITSIVVITMLNFLLNQPTSKLFYRATTDIRPISTFDEFDYELYNNYLKNTQLKQNLYSIGPYDESVNTKKRDLVQSNVDNSSFNKIDKYYLLGLFNDMISENIIIINAMKKFQLINKENYQNNEDYENAIIKLASTIQLTYVNNKQNNEKILRIQFDTHDKENWERILRSLEKTANLKIQKYLNSTFNILINNQKIIKKYKIEDINILMSTIEGDKKNLEYLINKKKSLLENKNIERLEKVFQSTPIAKSKEFYAARIMIETTKYKNLTKQKYQILPMLILSVIIGILIGIIFVLIANSVQNQKRKLSNK